MMPIKVFISHKKEDAEQAGAIAAHLTANGLSVYLDVIDAQLGKRVGRTLPTTSGPKWRNAPSCWQSSARKRKPLGGFPGKSVSRPRKSDFWPRLFPATPPCRNISRNGPISAQGRTSTPTSGNQSAQSFWSKTACKKVSEARPAHKDSGRFTPR